jgi:uncharacterized RDD family membrane protein YckC
MSTSPSPGAPPPQYAGFWIRFLAFCVDSLWTTLLIAPLAVLTWPAAAPAGGPPADLEALRGWILAQAPLTLWQSLLIALAVVAFWLYRAATPGKMLFRAVIIDADGGGTPGAGRLVIRYLGYFVNLFALGLGFLWVAWDPRKQGWHDKLARTVVVRRPATG